MSSGFTSINAAEYQQRLKSTPYTAENCFVCRKDLLPEQRVKEGFCEYDGRLGRAPLVCGVCKEERGNDNVRFDKLEKRMGLLSHLWSRHGVNPPGHSYTCSAEGCPYESPIQELADKHVSDQKKSKTGREKHQGAATVLVHIVPQLEPVNFNELGCQHHWIPKNSWISHLAKVANVECRRKMGMNW